MHTRQEVGSLLQKPWCDRTDAICMISNPLPQNTVIMGKIRMHMTVSSDVDDTAFAFKVMEVLPDGRTYNIRTAITTLGYRNGNKHRAEYIPNTKVDIIIDAWEIAYELQKGSKIRIDIASADFPQYAIHSNYAGPWALQKETRKAVQSLYIGGKAKSWIEIPVL